MLKTLGASEDIMEEIEKLSDPDKDKEILELVKNVI